VIQFVLKDLDIFPNDINQVMPPFLTSDMQEWIDGSGISDFHLAWTLDERYERLSQRKFKHIRYNTTIVFMNDRDAMLFKLRWSGEIA